MCRFLWHWLRCAGLLLVTLEVVTGVLPKTEEEAAALLANLTGRTVNLSNAKQVAQQSQGAPGDELLDHVLGMVVGDAAVQRLTSFEPNKTEGCDWPTCAAYCVPCAKTNKYWTCLSSATQCQENSECVLANCYAHPGYCYADAFPQKARCFMGAAAPTVRFNNDLILRLGAAPPVPLPKTHLKDWRVWAAQCLFVPICIFIFGLVVSFRTCHVLMYGRGTECHWLPRQRFCIVFFSILCVVILFYLQAYRYQQVASDIGDLDVQILKLESSLYKFRNLTFGLLQAKNVYNQSLYSAAGTCGEANPLATSLVQMLADLLRAEFDEVHAILEVVYDALDTACKLLRRGKQKTRDVGAAFLIWPTLPAFVMAFGMIAVVGVTLYIWNSESAAQSGWTVYGLKWFAPFITLFMIVSAVMGTVCLYASVVLSGYCLNIDLNLVAGARRTHFSELVKEPYNVDTILQHSANYYLLGTNINPLATVLQNIQAALHTVNNFYGMFEWLVNAATLSCSGINKLNPAPLVDELLETVEGAWDFIDVANIWPYYQKTVHGIVCSDTPWHMMMLFYIAMLAGMVFCPLLAIMASNHLKTFSYGFSRRDGSFKALSEEEAKQLDTEVISQAGLVVEKRLDRLDTLEQALVLDAVLDGRSTDVKQKLLELQEANSDSDDSSSSALETGRSG